MLAVVRPARLATASTDGASVVIAAIVLSTRPCSAGSTPRSIEACTGRVQGGSTLRAVKQPAPSRVNAHNRGIRSGVTKRGATPSIDTSTTGRRAVWTSGSGASGVDMRRHITPSPARGVPRTQKP